MNQYDCKPFFRLDGTCHYLTQRAEILSRRSNLTPQRAKNTAGMICLLFCGTEVAFDIKQAKAGWLYSFLSFLSETSKLQSAVYSEWK